MNDTTNHTLSLTFASARVNALAAKVANELHDALLEAASDLVREALAPYGLDLGTPENDAFDDLVMNEWVPDAYQAVLRAAIKIAGENLA